MGGGFEELFGGARGTQGEVGWGVVGVWGVVPEVLGGGGGEARGEVELIDFAGGGRGGAGDDEVHGGLERGGTWDGMSG